ncbi:MAG: hypothetical protein KJO82_10785 [Gammaproteobacteria bacterium]|nr:hypothetical protein [Gammaproteobacteria bacterium]
MRFELIIGCCLALFSINAIADSHERPQQAVVLDENLWVTFYDLPSRRFRAIRTAVLTRDKAAASADLAVAANYLSVEAERASDNFQGPLQQIADQLRAMGASVDDVTLQQLDVIFGRTHWLLAQHYLEFARRARDVRQNRNTSLYLWATIHHMERALLWSNVPVTRRVQNTFEDLREIATDLRDPQTAESAYKEKPVIRAETLLRQIGDQIDRRVLLPAAASSE